MKIHNNKDRLVDIYVLNDLEKTVLQHTSISKCTSAIDKFFQTNWVYLK